MKKSCFTTMILAVALSMLLMAGGSPDERGCRTAEEG